MESNSDSDNFLELFAIKLIVSWTLKIFGESFPNILYMIRTKWNLVFGSDALSP